LVSNFSWWWVSFSIAFLAKAAHYIEMSLIYKVFFMLSSIQFRLSSCLWISMVIFVISSRKVNRFGKYQSTKDALFNKFSSRYHNWLASAISSRWDQDKLIVINNNSLLLFSEVLSWIVSHLWVRQRNSIFSS